MLILVSLFIACAVMFVYILLLRAWASREEPFFAVIIPANCSALVSKKPNTRKVADKDKDATGVNNDGGDIANVLHAIPGKRLNKSDPDPMNWKYEKGEEPRGLFFRLIGVQFIWLFRYLRLMDIRTFRYGRTDKGTEYSVMAKTQHTRYPFFSGQHDIQMEHIETQGILRIDLLFNLIIEETYPVRVHLRTADPYAVLTLMVRKLVIRLVGGKDPREIIKEKDVQNDILKEIEEFSSVIEYELGLTVKKASLADIGFDDETARLLEMETRTDIEAKAKVREAEGDRDAKIARNEGDIHRLQNVIIPAAETAERSKVFRSDRESAAYENNDKVTTYAPGSGVRPVVTLDEK